MARESAAELLDALESDNASVAQVLMRAKRLARLLRDEEAQLWLDLETKGYPSGFAFTRLGTCERYAVEGGRVTSDGKYYSQSLPKIEAEAHAAESALNGGLSGDISLPHIENYVAAGATTQVLTIEANRQAAIRSNYASWSSLQAAMRAAIHAYATDVSLALELGDAAEDIFEAARREVDVFVRANCPTAVQQLLSINERMRQADPESLSAALTSCRRLLVTVADSLFPPRTEPYIDAEGRPRKVGPEEYKNRLIAYFEQSVVSSGTRRILTSDLAHIAARIDAVNDKASKGVHADVDSVEARLAVIGTYLLVAEVARVAANTPEGGGAASPPV